ncbi:hypothetical protein A2U01_0091447, partial [Trifolium medium]|nr:hypothetical protein [Trifolium medium]
TAIKEANNLNTLDLTSLFGKLEEHEQEIIAFREHETRMKKEKQEGKNKEKSKALRTSSSMLDTTSRPL